MKKPLRKNMYELLLLRNWNEIFFQDFPLNTENNILMNFKKEFTAKDAFSNLDQSSFPSLNLQDQHFVRQLKLYSRLNQISKSLLDRSVLNFNDSTLNKKILKFKTPLLISDLQTFELQKKSQEIENPINLDIQTMKTNIQYSNFGDQANEKIYLKSLKNLSYSKLENLNLISFKGEQVKKNLSDGKSQLQIWKTFISKKTEFLFPFEKISTYKNVSLQKLSLTTDLVSQSQIKKFSISRDSQNGKMKLITVNAPLKRKLTKDLNSRQNLPSTLKNFNFKQRKAEKIFRLYASIKSSKDLSLKLSSESSNNSIFYNLQTLKRLKKRIKKSQSTKNYLNSSSLYLKLNSAKNSSMNSHLNALSDNSSKNPENDKNISPFKNRKILQTSQSKLFLKNLATINFFKKSDLGPGSPSTETDAKRLQTRQSIEKKRRLKKLKLENRRRKKRKRFYPRPNYLRFNLYSSFLKDRYLKTDQPFSVNLASKIVQDPQTQKFKSSSNFKQKLYRQKKQKWGSVSNDFQTSEKWNMKQSLLSFLKPSYHQQEFYKISNATLTEFEKLCWKSYWLRSNLRPYILKIQTNLKKMKELEQLKNSQLPIFNGLLQKNQDLEKPNLNLYKQMKNITPTYLNIKQSFAPKNVDTYQNFKILENQLQYDKLIYQRMMDEIKNVKSQLNLDGKTQARSYKPGRKKLDNSDMNQISQTNSFLMNLQNNFSGVGQESQIPTFSNPYLISPISIKPVGDLPTLRVLWAFNKTNLFKSNSNNFTKNLWESYKYREKFKNNKTKKFLVSLFKSPQSSPSALKKVKVFDKTFNDLTQKKVGVVDKKLDLFGSFLYRKNYNKYLRTIKLEFNTFSKSNVFKNSPQTNEINSTTDMNPSLLKQFQLYSENLTKNPTLQPNHWFNPLLVNKTQAQNINFWWSTKQNNLIDKNAPSSMFVFFPFRFANFEYYISENTHLLKKTATNMNGLLSDIQLNKTLALSSFWIACSLFHVSILFALIRIPQIRSLLKFQFLVLVKLTNVYLLGLSAVYDLFQNYKDKLTLLGQRIAKVSKTQFLNSKNLDSDQPLNFVNLSSDRSQWKNRSKYIQKIHSMSPEKSYDFLDMSESNNWNRLPIQSTFHLNFIFRNFDTLRNTDILTENRALLKRESLSPFYKKVKNSSFSNRPVVNTKLKKKTNTFYSWYTGILWSRFPSSTNVSRANFLEKKLQFLSKNQQKSTKTKLDIQTTSKQMHGSALRLESFGSTVKIQTMISLSILYLFKSIIFLFYSGFNLVYKALINCIDALESILLIFYKFFEKPAEVMVNWIAEIFLIEWTADLTSYVPETFDEQIWNSVVKFSRLTRAFPPFVSSFFMQRFFLSTFQTFYIWLYKSDIDLLMRQKKGMIFWDIWTEILLQAAENYKMNLSSLSTLKEEQELLIENLLQEKDGNLGNTIFKKFNSKKENSQSVNSKIFKSSLEKVNPLSDFLNIYPDSILQITESSKAFKTSAKWNLNLKPSKYANLLTQSNSQLQLKSENDLDFDLLNTKNSVNLQKRWSVNQYLTMQGRDTDLFIDVHPPKSFLHVRFFKNYLSSQETLGPLVCQIYSGLFANLISKNLLIVGPSGTTKSFFIQALAGETELKIVTDNARRYSLVQGGVPIGMKLLRDVFDSIVLHTPCLFLLEDIHIIGERRPNLISDDEVLKSKDLTFGSEQDEIHEKNRLIYQQSRHSLSHYKRPYKGDFSFSIPTNHFCYDLFLGIQPPRKRRSDLTVKSPFPLSEIEKKLSTLEGSGSNDRSNSQNKKTSLMSLLQISGEQIFAPPATSPFTILLMKEQKKFKPKKLVKEMPWAGLAFDELMLISKSNYSIRVKVSLLADLAMNTLSVKLDMITDLLVIIDSVRSNRGFVVFATTHVPSLLDPALRRPGRFDETISLPSTPNLLARFEILKVNLGSYAQVFDFLDYSFLSSKNSQTEQDIYFSISKSLSLLFNSKYMNERKISDSSTPLSLFGKGLNDYPIYSLSQAIETSQSLSSLIVNSKKFQKVLKFHKLGFENKYQKEKYSKFNLLSSDLNMGHSQTLLSLLAEKSSNVILSQNDQLNYLTLSYAKAGQFLMESLVLNDQFSYLGISGTKQDFMETENYQELNFQSFYSSKNQSKQILVKLFAGKISEFFSLNNTPKSNSNLKTRPTMGRTSFENIQNFQSYWQSAINFLDSLFQKRYLYNKNSIVSKMLFFENFTSLREPPSPPNSLILAPGKKFENYQRKLKDFTEKPNLTINEKIQIHQKQRFLKHLYNVSVQNSFPTLTLEKTSSKFSAEMKYTTFSTSFKELGYLDFLTIKPSSTYSLYKNQVLTRQRFNLLNQWWNGQLAEHNVETTYLSHIDWRSIFVPSIGDLVLDFPDAEQYYNPKNRRWFLQSKSWAYWFEFEKTFKYEIFQHFILDCFATTSNILNSNREVFDYLAFSFLVNHKLKEIDLIDTLVRFEKSQDC